MSATAIVTKKIVAGGRTIEADVSITAEGEQAIPGLTIAAGQTDKEVQVAFVVARVKYFYAKSTKALTLKNNAGGDQTLTLAANDPYEWHLGDGGAFKFTTDTTKLLATNGGADDAVLDIVVGYDATP